MHLLSEVAVLTILYYIHSTNDDSEDDMNFKFTKTT